VQGASRGSKRNSKGKGRQASILLKLAETILKITLRSFSKEQYIHFKNWPQMEPGVLNHYKIIMK
jgi:hypothetical protein